MNCAPLPLPTFLAPERSKGGPPLEAVAGALAARSTCGASAPGEGADTCGAPAPGEGADTCGASAPGEGADTCGASAPGGGADTCGASAPGGAAGADGVSRSIKALAEAGAAAEPPPKPQPVFPCWSAAPGPEQIPVGLAQQPLAQSASERHCPVINCLPALLPTFGAPLGSKGGTAATKEARATMVAANVMDFIMGCFERGVVGKCNAT